MDVPTCGPADGVFEPIIRESPRRKEEFDWWGYFWADYRARGRRESPPWLTKINDFIEKYPVGPCGMVAPRIPGSLGHSANQRALKDIVDDVTRGGRRPLSVDDAHTVLDWAAETNYPGARANPGCVDSPSTWTGGPHIHIPGAGRGGHVPVVPGVKPRQ